MNSTENKHNAQRSLGILLVLCAAILWGTTGTAQSFAPLSLSPYWVGAARLVVSGFFFIGLLLVTDRQTLSLAQLKLLPWRLILTAAFCMLCYNLSFFAGIRQTSIAIGTAVALGSAPVWAGLIQAAWLRSMPSGNWWLALSIAVAGLLLTTFGRNEAENAVTMAGLVLCLISGLSYALYAQTTKKLILTTSARVSTTWVFTCAALMAVPFAYLLAGPQVLSVANVPVLLWLGIAATGISYLLFSTGLRYVSSATGVALALAEPIAAVLLAIVVVGERPGLLSLSGMLIVFIGLCLIIRLELRES